MDRRKFLVAIFAAPAAIKAFAAAGVGKADHGRLVDAANRAWAVTKSGYEDASIDARGILTWRGPVIRAGVPTINGHVYPQEAIDRAVRDFASAPPRRMLGQIVAEGGVADGRPWDGRVSLSEASHVVTGLKAEGDCLIAEIETLGTPHGRILVDLARNGILPAFRPAGTGEPWYAPATGLTRIKNYRIDTVLAHPREACAAV
jgi:hypothetical protein